MPRKICELPASAWNSFPSARIWILRSDTMTNQIHGHEVIEMMTGSNETYTTTSLQAAIINRFGAEARFHTCSAANMDAGELIAFLAGRGKFTERPGGFSINPDKVCAH